MEHNVRYLFEQDNQILSTLTWVTRLKNIEKQRSITKAFIHSQLESLTTYIALTKIRCGSLFPVDTGRELNVHKTFRRCPGYLLIVLCTFNLRPVSTGLMVDVLLVTAHHGNVLVIETCKTQTLHHTKKIFCHSFMLIQSSWWYILQWRRVQLTVRWHTCARVHVYFCTEVAISRCSAE